MNALPSLDGRGTTTRAKNRKRKRGKKNKESAGFRSADGMTLTGRCPSPFSHRKTKRRSSTLPFCSNKKGTEREADKSLRGRKEKYQRETERRSGQWAASKAHLETITSCWIPSSTSPSTYCLSCGGCSCPADGPAASALLFSCSEVSVVAPRSNPVPFLLCRRRNCLIETKRLLRSSLQKQKKNSSQI